MTDGLAPIAIALSRYLLEHGDYVVAGTLPSEFEAARGEGLRNFMAEVAKEGRDIAEESQTMEDSVDGDLEGMELGGEKEGEEKSEMKQKRRKRWRDRFRVVRLDGRLVCSSTRV